MSEYLPPFLSLDAPIEPPGPDEGPVCFQFDAKWLPYVIAVLKTLTLDGVYTSDQARAKGEASQLLQIFMGRGNCASFNDLSGSEGDDCMGCCIRMRNGVLQVLQCGEWVTVDGWDLSGAVNNQPGEGAPQPDAGKCQEFGGVISPLISWNLPVPVSSGDQITVTNLNGQWVPIEAIGPALGVWYCPDGNIYFAGGCADGTSTTDSRDPMPSAPLFGTVATDGTNYYDVSAAATVGGSAVFTIPSGISNRNLVFKCNTYTAIQPGGEVNFLVEICKAASANFRHVFNFPAGSESWAIGSASGQPLGQYVVTQGFEAIDSTGPNPQRSINMSRVLASRTLTRIEVTFDMVMGNHTSPAGIPSQDVNLNGTDVIFNDLSHAVTGTNQTLVWTGSQATVTAINLYFICDFVSTPHIGSVLIKSIVVEGEGADPF